MKQASKPKLITVVGQTATGKSDVAVEIARAIGGEVISADSRQVYKGLDIGSGKITKREMRGVLHHLLDVVSPRSTFTVVQFQKKVRRIIDDIIKRGKIPIIAGGTGFYIDAVTNDTPLPEVKPNPTLRKQLEKKSLTQLLTQLKKLDSERADSIDTQNKVRLIRAIEIAKAIGKTPPLSKKKTADTNHYSILHIGLTWDDNTLRKRIHDRLLKRMKQGMVAEVRNLHDQGISWKRLESLGLEYRYMALFLQNKMTKEEMLTELETKIWQYAKRQKTWFKRNTEIKWFTPTQENIKKVVKLSQNFVK